MNKTAITVLRDVIPASPVFTTRMAAETASVSRDVASRDLARLAEENIIVRITQGIWADVRHPDFSPYAVVPHLLRARRSDAPGYVSLLSALNLRGMIQQIPRVIQVVVTEQRRSVRTAVGTYEFHQIDPVLFGGYEPFGQLGNFEVATATKALFDVIYLSVRRGRRFSHLPELDLPKGFRAKALEKWIRTIPHSPVRAAVTARWLTMLAHLPMPQRV